MSPWTDAMPASSASLTRCATRQRARSPSCGWAAYGTSRCSPGTTSTPRLVAGRLGIDEVHAGSSPPTRRAIVGDLKAQGRRVVMVGDGVNDAPALATADLGGVAMGGAGTDVSMETADVVIMTDRLDQLAHARRVAGATVRVMKQNTAPALGTVSLLVAAVLLQLIQLAGGMLVHEISVLLVILNALRLVRLEGPRSRAEG